MRRKALASGEWHRSSHSEDGQSLADSIGEFQLSLCMLAIEHVENSNQEVASGSSSWSMRRGGGLVRVAAIEPCLESRNQGPDQIRVGRLDERAVETGGLEVSLI